VLIKNKKKQLIIWGSGKPKRELMYVDDLADACLFFLKKNTKETLINIGSSVEMTIAQYARFILKKFNSNLIIKFDKSKPDGIPRKILDTTIAKKYGWSSKISLDKGFDITLKNYFNKIKKKKINE